MPIELKEVPRLLDSELNRAKMVLDFLKRGRDKGFTEEEISEETGVKCFHELLRRYSYGDKENCGHFLDENGLDSVYIIKKDGERFCGTETYYFYNPAKDKSLIPKEPEKTERKGFWAKIFGK